MKYAYLIATIAVFALTAFMGKSVDMMLQRETTVDSLGACQGISYQNGRIYLYGDREVGIIR